MRHGAVTVRHGAAPRRGQTVGSEDQTSLALLVQVPHVSVHVRKSSRHPMPQSSWWMRPSLVRPHRTSRPLSQSATKTPEVLPVARHRPSAVRMVWSAGEETQRWLAEPSHRRRRR